MSIVIIYKRLSSTGEHKCGFNVFTCFSELLDYKPVVSEEFKLVEKDPEVTVQSCNCEHKELVKNHDEL